MPGDTRHLLITILSILIISLKVNGQIIDAYAGIFPSGGYSGDGGPATSARLDYPSAIATDDFGNLYIGEFNNNVIRKVNSSGIISTFAGNNIAGYSGDGGPATSASLNGPSYVVCDHLGNVYIADTYNSVIRKVNSAGVITTFAGIGSAGYSGDGGADTGAQLMLVTIDGLTVDRSGNLYVAQSLSQVVRKINTTGIISTFAGIGIAGYSGDGGPATSAALDQPSGIVADDNGNVYISCTGSAVIRKVGNTGIITTFAGTGSLGYSGDGGPALLAEFQITSPAGLAIDQCGNIYVADYGNYVVRVINAAGIINTIIGNNTNGFSGNGGLATAAQLWFPIAVAVNQVGDIYVTDVYSNNVRKVTSANPTVIRQPLNVSACENANAAFSVIAGGASGYHWQSDNGLGWQDLNDGGFYSGTTTANLQISAVARTLNGVRFRCRITTICNDIYSFPANLTVNNSIASSVTISTPVTNICSGTSIIFTAVALNAGANPVFQWKKNGLAVGANDFFYTDNSLQNNDKIICEITSSSACTSSLPVQSNQISIQVNTLVPVSVSVTSPDKSICSGKEFAFDAVPVNGGVNPDYSWYLNGIDLSHHLQQYITDSLHTGDRIVCTMRADIGCPSQNVATSSEVKVNVASNPVVTLDKSQIICKGTSRILDAGSFFSYLWNDGSNKKDLSVNDTGVYFVTVTDGNGCKATDTTKIISFVEQPSNFLPRDTAICPGNSLSLHAIAGFSAYLWSTGSMTPELTILNPGTYWLELTTTDQCSGRDTIVVKEANCLTRIFIPAGFTPNFDGRNDLLKPIITGTVKFYRFTVYNRSGSAVFTSTTPGEGWDGTVSGIPQNTSVFVWICNYEFEGQPRKLEKGTVALIR